jgi:hypothetical protein
MDLVGSPDHGSSIRESPSRAVTCLRTYVRAEVVAMNARAVQIIGALRALLGTLPGATSVGLHAMETWTLLLITAASDEAVSVLGASLELGPVELRRNDTRWWYCATAEYECGALRVSVNGPPHTGTPPKDGEPPASV